MSNDHPEISWCKRKDICFKALACATTIFLETNASIFLQSQVDKRQRKQKQLNFFGMGVKFDIYPFISLCVYLTHPSLRPSFCFWQCPPTAATSPSCSSLYPGGSLNPVETVWQVGLGGLSWKGRPVEIGSSSRGVHCSKLCARGSPLDAVCLLNSY